MNQVYQQQLYHQQQQAEQLKAMKRAQKRSLSLLESNDNLINENLNDLSVQAAADDLQNLTLNTSNEKSTSNQSTNDTRVELIDGVFENNEDDEPTPEMPPISAATLLTRKDINEFKQMVRRENDAIIKVGSGETVTVRVPTHDDGRLIFWEFASDHFDLAFGLYFEWTIAPTKNVTVHVSDSSEDEEENGEGDEEKAKVDAEKGDKVSNKPPCDEIIPIFRRDCHQEVYAGSHLYPGRGVYLLKFDNSYSLWRSKTLYYRVYYSK
jgi:golgi resident protein GCP60